jgi:hypothetical protein
MLLVLGAALSIAAGALLVTSVAPWVRAETITIPEGPSNFYAYEFRIVGSGRLAGSFEETSGRDVGVLVFTAAEYVWFEFIGAGTPIAAAIASTGSFDVRLPDSGTYVLVFAHPSWADAATQIVDVRVRLEGARGPLLDAGTWLLAPGVLLLVTAVLTGPRWRSRSKTFPTP